MISRRRFLQGVGAAGLAVGLENCAPAKSEAVSLKAERRTLVVVNIDGGWDWLNVLAPLALGNRTAYAAARPALAIPTGQLLDVGNNIGFNTDLTGFDAFWNEKRAAFIPGIGMNNPNLSHFVAQDLWGQGAAIPDGSGWLGRFADAAFAPQDVLRGLSVTNDLPVMLRGHERLFVSISGASGYVYPSSLRGNGRLGSPWDPQAIEDGWGRAVNSTAADVPSLVSLAGQAGYGAGAFAGKLFYDAQNGFGVNGTLPARTPSVPYPGDAAYPVKRLDGGNLNGGLSSQLKLIARMIASGVTAQVFFARLGGWDTHSNQATDHPNLQRALGGSLRAFHQDLASIPAPGGTTMQDKTIVMTYSEFGRRVPENNGGTDHGTAGLSLVVGNGVNGGVWGNGYPNLNDLDGNQNMKFTTDFRSLYATLLERWLNLTPSTTNSVLGGAYPRLGFI